VIRLWHVDQLEYATCLRGPIRICHVDQLEYATCLRGPVRICRVDQLEYATCIKGPVRICHVAHFAQAEEGGAQKRQKSSKKLQIFLSAFFDFLRMKRFFSYNTRHVAQKKRFFSYNTRFTAS